MFVILLLLLLLLRLNPRWGRPLWHVDANKLYPGPSLLLGLVPSDLFPQYLSILSFVSGWMPIRVASRERPSSVSNCQRTQSIMIFEAGVFMAACSCCHLCKAAGGNFSRFHP